MVQLQTEFDYYLKNQKKLLKEHEGKFIVIKGEDIIGTYDDEMTAYQESLKSNKEGTFLIQHCLPGDESYTQTFHSRAVFH